MADKTYTPSEEILDRYADVLVNFALNSGEGIKKGEVVFLQVSESAKPMLIALRRAVLKAGAYPIINYLPDDISKEYYEIANYEQLNFFPEKYLKGKIEQAHHFVSIISDTNKYELKDVDPKKIMIKSKAFKPYMDWKTDKENRGELTWTLGLYGTEAMAKEANLTLEEYWEQIIKACQLDHESPVSKWKEIMAEVERVKNNLNEMNIKKLRIKSEDTDLIVGIGKNREWMGGSGRNIPSFEIFISPDWRQTEGYAKFNQPLYRYGNLIEGIYLEFKNGKVVRAKAEKGEELLKEMIATDEGSDKIGEFSLTDSRLSRIEKFMAETLFDENIGGEHGNMHIALGSAYKDSYPGDLSNMSEEQWKEMGYNDSVVHTDIVSTKNREVSAELENGTEIIIYKDGKFTI